MTSHMQVKLSVVGYTDDRYMLALCVGSLVIMLMATS